MLAKHYELHDTPEGHGLAYKYYALVAKNGDLQATKEIATFLPDRAKEIYQQAERLWNNKALYPSEFKIPVLQFVVPACLWRESILANTIVFNDGFPPKARGIDGEQESGILNGEKYPYSSN